MITAERPGETEAQRNDRNLVELLQELRVAAVGVQRPAAGAGRLPPAGVPPPSEASPGAGRECDGHRGPGGRRPDRRRGRAAGGQLCRSGPDNGPRDGLHRWPIWGPLVRLPADPPAGPDYSGFWTVGAAI